MRKRKKSIIAGISTYTRNSEPLKLYEPETLLEDGGAGANLLHMPEDFGPMSTYRPSLKANNVSDLDNDIDPATGYLPERTEDGYEYEEGDASDTVLINASEDDGEWDEDADDIDLEDDEDDEELVDEIEELSSNVIEDENTYDLVDVDGIDDADIQGMLFATNGSRLYVLKANRIIAELTKSTAEDIGIEDVYLTDTFEEATLASVQRQGLRAGLQGMGFKLARVNIGASRILNRRVEAMVKKRTAKVLASNKHRDAILAQSLAIASVGINRKFFKGKENVLANALIKDLSNAGVINAEQIINAAFAKHGVDYAYTLLDQAKVLASLDATTRNQFAKAVDLIDESGEFVDSTYTVEDTGEVDVIDATKEDLQFEEEEFTESIQASLLSQGIGVSHQMVENHRKGISLSASTILNSDEVLQF